MNRSHRWVWIVAIAAVAALAFAGCDTQTKKTGDRLTARITTVNAAFAAGNAAAIAADFGADGELTAPRGAFKGNAEIAAYYQGLIDTFAGLKITETGRVVQGNRANYEATIEGVHKGSGKPVKIAFAATVEYSKEGKIASYHSYFDQASIAKQLE